MLFNAFFLLSVQNATLLFYILLRPMAVFQTMALLTPIDLKRLVCDGAELDQYVYFGSQAEKEAFQDISCALSPQQLITTQQVLLQNLQPRKVLSEVSYPCLFHWVSEWTVLVLGS